MNSFTLAQWQQTPRFQKALARFLATEAGRALLLTLDDQAPLVNRTPLDFGFACTELGRLNERIIIKKQLLAMAQPFKPAPAPEEIPADYSTSPIPNLK